MRATAAVPEPWLCVPSRLPPRPVRVLSVKGHRHGRDTKHDVKPLEYLYRKLSTHTTA